MRQALWVETDNLIRAANRGTLFMTQHNRFSDYTAEEKRAILNLHAPVSTGRATDDTEAKRVRHGKRNLGAYESVFARKNEDNDEEMSPRPDFVSRKGSGCPDGTYYNKRQKKCLDCKPGCKKCRSKY